MSFYVIVRGPLGSGKTIVSERLARALGGDRISVDSILGEHDLERWEDGFISERSFLEANAVAIRAAEPRLEHGLPVVFDGNFYWRSVVDDLVERLRAPHLVVTLRVPVEVCLARDAEREHPLGPESVRDVYRKSTEFDYGVDVDATGTVDQTVDAILGQLRSLGLTPP